MESEGRRVPTFVLVGLLVVVALGVVAWIATGRGPDISQVPPGVPVVKVDGFALAVNELKVGELMQISMTLEIPKGRFQAPWYTLEGDPDSKLWVRYGGREYAARCQVTPARMPEGSPIDRVWLSGFFAHGIELPKSGEAIEAGLTVPAAAVRRPTPLAFTVKGVEKVARFP